MRNKNIVSVVDSDVTIESERGYETEQSGSISSEIEFGVGKHPLTPESKALNESKSKRFAGWRFCYSLVLLIYHFQFP